MENFESELKRFFEYTNTHKISDLALALGVSATTIRTWRTRNKIPENIYRKMELSLKDDRNKDEITLPFYDFRIIRESSAIDKINDETKLISINKLLLPDNLNINLHRTFITKAEGDAMEPTIKKGATLLIDKEDQALSDGIFLISINGTIVVRRIHFKLSEGMSLMTDNDFYPNHDECENLFEHIGKHKALIKVIGKVIWIGQNT